MKTLYLIVPLAPLVGSLIAGLFVLLFATAALQKLRAPMRFAELFAAYRVLPAGLARLSLLVPALELLVAAGLLVRPMRTIAAGTGAALLVVYAAAIGVNLRRGRHDLACGAADPTSAARSPRGWSRATCCWPPYSPWPSCRGCHGPLRVRIC
jgi:hypothetical protein